MSAAHATGEQWPATLQLQFARCGARTELVRRQQRGPLAVQRPFHPEGAPCHCYLLHPPGGIAGGDTLAIDVAVAADAHALITTPGASKFYRCLPGRQAQLQQRLQVAAEGILEWLPQENILFSGSDAQLDTHIELASNSRFIGWELTILGRPTQAERFDQGALQQRLQLTVDGVPQLIDQLSITGGDRQLDASCALRGAPLTATLLAWPTDAALLAAARAAIPRETADAAVAITALDQLLVVRWLGSQAEQARRTLIPIWQQLRRQLIALPALPPRIWAT